MYNYVVWVFVMKFFFMSLWHFCFSLINGELTRGIESLPSTYDNVSISTSFDIVSLWSSISGLCASSLTSFHCRVQSWVHVHQSQHSLTSIQLTCKRPLNGHYIHDIIASSLLLPPKFLKQWIPTRSHPHYTVVKQDASLWAATAPMASMHLCLLQRGPRFKSSRNLSSPMFLWAQRSTRERNIMWRSTHG